MDFIIAFSKLDKLFSKHRQLIYSNSFVFLLKILLKKYND